MARYELVLRNGTLATAGEVVKADVGVREGRIVALGEELGAGDVEIDAAGKIVTPGGVVVCDGGELKAEIGRGEFLRCATPEPATLGSEASRGSGA